MTYCGKQYTGFISFIVFRFGSGLGVSVGKVVGEAVLDFLLGGVVGEVGEFFVRM